MKPLTLSQDRKDLAITLNILKNDPLAIVGLIIAVALLGTSAAVLLFGTMVVPYDPTAINLALAFQPPSPQHLLGTDNLGRDVLSRAIMATPIDAEIAFAIIGISAFFGLIFGSISGFLGGHVDDIFMRVTDLFLAFPSLVLAIAVAVALGPGVNNVIEANLVVWWPVYARLARAGALSLNQVQYVDAARIAGLSRFGVLLRHIIPNNISPILVYGTLDLGNAILYASVLSYLGLGAQPPQAEWGRMVFDGQIFLTGAWWISIMPGLIILIIALGFNLLGDALRDVFDPRYRK
jgi:peptide/nickel transport system permease protein